MEKSKTPKRPDEQLSIRLPVKLRRRFKAHCAKKGKTITEVLTGLIENELKPKRKE